MRTRADQQGWTMKKDRSSSEFDNNAKKPILFLSITIVSATYGPCEQVANVAERVSFTRDVTPFVWALLQLLVLEEQQEEEDLLRPNERDGGTGSIQTSIRDPSQDPLVNQQDDIRRAMVPTTTSLSAIHQGQRRTLIELLPSPNYADLPGLETPQSNRANNTSGSSSFVGGMNGIFGDPIPGTSKRLTIQYRITSSDDDNDDHHREGSLQTDSFAEHERVYLRCRHWKWEADPNNQQLQQQQHDHDPTVAVSPVATTDRVSSSSSKDPNVASATAITNSVAVYQDVGCWFYHGS